MGTGRGVRGVWVVRAVQEGPGREGDAFKHIPAHTCPLALLNSVRDKDLPDAALYYIVFFKIPWNHDTKIKTASMSSRR